MIKVHAPHRQLNGIEIDCSARADISQIGNVIAQSVAADSIQSVCFNLAGRAILSSSLLDEIDRWIQLGLEIQIRNLEPHLRRISLLDETVRIVTPHSHRECPVPISEP